MKLKKDFTTNSSSASFLISKKKITAEQREKIIEYAIYAKEYVSEWDMWNISENSEFISGSTIMDNFDMFEYLATIGITKDMMELYDEN